MNDEAHHCYREKAARQRADKLTAEDRQEAKENNEAARLWISGIEALKRKVGVRAVYDLSATPFFLRGSGYEEGTLFPWVVSDFSLIDAIECGIVKLPRVPVSDNARSSRHASVPHLGACPTEVPKKGAANRANSIPIFLPVPARPSTRSTATTRRNTTIGSAPASTPPVFIVVCNNTATSKLVYEWISG